MAALGEKITLFSPAKLNLFFRVLYRREDRFHEIASLFQTISLGDQLAMEIADQDKLYCSDPSIPTDSSNLVWKAVNLFRKKTGREFCVSIDLQKKIPIEAGLGGGSSNAATALWGLNKLLKTGFSDEEMQSWSMEIGSDVPFFFSRGVAYCTGRGEKVKNLGLSLKEHLWIAKPRYGLSTPLIYGNCRPDLLPARDPLEALKQFSEGCFEPYNDLEFSAFQVRPDLVEFRKSLLDIGFGGAVMTGSGSSFFCFSKERMDAPSLPGVDFFSASFLVRQQENWYTFSS